MARPNTDIYKLELFEGMPILDRGAFVTRVPGGWIYESTHADDGWNSVFIPYSEEFNPEAA